jgi:hypothetical protein
MMDAGNGKIHLVEITVMIGLAPEGSIQHDLLCLLLHPQMLVCCLLGWVGTRHVQQVNQAQLEYLQDCFVFMK